MKSEEDSRICDKCGQSVETDNDAYWFDIELKQLRGDVPSREDFMRRSRHLFPVPGCEGSPSRRRFIRMNEIGQRAYDNIKSHKKHSEQKKK